MSLEAACLKEEGNACFREKRYHKAIEFYSQSLQKQLTAPVFGNRAQSYLNLEKWPEALMDCNRALELDPNFAKALYRRACALEKMGLKSSAIEDLNRCLKLGPSAAASALKDKLTGKRDADVIHVACVEKGDEIRSDSEFNEIVIDISQSTAEDQAKSESLANGKTPAENDCNDFRFRVPKTHREFLLDYRELQRLPPEKFVKYFMAIPTSGYPSLFGELLEAEVIGTLLRGFSTLLESNGIEAHDVSTCLLSLSDLPRFQLLSMFFGDDEKKDLEIICRFLPRSDAVTIREKYGVEEINEE